jgi:5-methyltetrahydrofolate--homocysteine methyltransferase
MNGKTVFRESPLMMASYIPEIIKAGASIIGGCCGTTPEHIKEMAKVLGK